MQEWLTKLGNIDPVVASLIFLLVILFGCLLVSVVLLKKKGSKLQRAEEENAAAIGEYETAAQQSDHTIAALKQRLSKLQAEHETRIAELIHNAADEAEQLRKEKEDSLAAMQEDYESKLASLQADASQAQAQYNELSAEHHQLKAVVEQRETAVNDLQSKLESKFQQVSALNHSLEQHQEEHFEAMATLQNEVERAKAELTTVQQEHAAQVAALQETIETLESEKNDISMLAGNLAKQVEMQFGTVASGVEDTVEQHIKNAEDVLHRVYQTMEPHFQRFREHKFSFEDESETAKEEEPTSEELNERLGAIQNQLKDIIRRYERTENPIASDLLSEVEESLQSIEQQPCVSLQSATSHQLVTALKRELDYAKLCEREHDFSGRTNALERARKTVEFCLVR